MELETILELISDYPFAGVVVAVVVVILGLPVVLTFCLILLTICGFEFHWRSGGAATRQHSR